MAAERTHRAEYEVDHWRGHVVALTLFVQFMADALDTEGTGDVDIESAVYVEYTDGNAKWDSLKEFADAADKMSMTNVQSIRYQASRREPSRLSLTVLASQGLGVKAVVTGERDLLVHGLVAEAKKWIDKGRVPPKLSERRPIRLGDVAAVGAVVAVTLVLCVGLPWAFDVWAWQLIAFGGIGGLVGLVGTGWVIQDLAPLYPEAPALVWTKKKESSEPVAQPKPGPIMRGAAWLKRHPVIALLGTFVLGVLTNVVASALPS